MLSAKLLDVFAMDPPRENEYYFSLRGFFDVKSDVKEIKKVL